MKEIIFFIVFFFLISCKEVAREPLGNNFYFVKPQPSNDSELLKFPTGFRGLFMDSDSLYLEINENTILQKYINRFRIHFSELDSIKSEFKITGDKFVSKSNNELYYRKDVGDSIQFSNTQIDTFFVFSDDQKAKRINGHLILNTKDSIYWGIKILNLEKDVLRLKYVYSDEDLKKMDSVTKIKSQKIDSSSYILRPTRREFKKILKLENLGEERQFKKVSK
ncbi:hypothetical protein [Flavobacterium limnosediminis]|uniref:hypothetical protein n=1 Tax=Flavobacterium limnosediminis TaxID=1401027 RepID=UPI0004163C2D|nr:hypothetical protein [Flavobacterium limnosediminis]